MNKGFQKLAILIALFTVLATFASAEMIISRQECQDGLTFVIENTGQYVFRPMDFSIIGIHSSEKKLVFDGVWKNLGEPVGSKDSGMKFLSNNTIPQYGSYAINVTRLVQDENHLIDGRPEIKFKESATFKISCEEQAFECSKVNLRIDDCYSVNGRYYGVFSGIGKQTEFNPYERFNIKISSRSELISGEVPNDIIMGEIDSGRYYVSFPHIGKAWTTMTINGCDYERYSKTFAKQECSHARSCTDDSECNANEYCNTDKGGACQQILCKECEKPSEHACIAKCEDENVCTQDTCTEGACRNTKIPNCCQTASDCGQSTLCKTISCVNNQCETSQKDCKESDDPCIVGACNEDKGCEYKIDEQCRIGWLQKIINWITDFFR